METSYEIMDNKLRFWLKNENAGGERKVWRYQHFDSHAPFVQKRALLMACLRKVQHMACDERALMRSALDKIREFQRLRYPNSILAKACNYLGATTGVGTWIAVRDMMNSPNGPKAE